MGDAYVLAGGSGMICQSGFVGNKVNSIHEKVRELSHLLQRAEQCRQPLDKRFVSTGCLTLDRLMHRQGFLRGSLVEWLEDGPGSGASILALVAAREACTDRGVLIVVDRSGAFYPPAAAAWGIDLKNMIVVQPKSDKDEHWTLVQALRCERVAAVVSWTRRLDGYTYRRLQLAAESGGSVGLFVRPQTAHQKPSWADVRMSVSPQPSPDNWLLRVRILRCRGRLGGGDTVLQIDHRSGLINEAHTCNLAS